MGIPGSANLLMLGGGAQAYQIEQSLRFDGSSYLQRTIPTRLTQNPAVCTLSVWIKRGSISDTFQYILEGYRTSTVRSVAYFDASAMDTLKYWYINNGTAQGTTGAFRDTSAWLHYVLKISTGTTSYSTETFINGVSVQSNSGPTTNYYQYPFFIGGDNNAVTLRVGDDIASAGYPFKGYFAEMHLVDGTALDADSFGEFDDNGVWRPIKYTGSYGTEGWYLKFDPNATNGIGHDHSGNGNNFTASGFTTSGTGTDVMSDTPTTNWCTMNPLNINDSLYTYSNGNLDLSAGNGWSVTTASFYTSSGKWYYEYTVNSGSNHIAGITAVPEANTNLGVGAYSYAYQQNGQKWNNNSSTSYGATWGTAGDVIGVAYDLDNNEIEFYKNNVSQGVAFTSVTSLPVSPAISIYGGSGTVNFGQRAFAYTPPTGYKALNTANLPAPDIADGSQYFDTVLWTGNQTARTISMNSTFTPDFIWIKNRTSGYNHSLQDVVRGFGPSTKLNSNTTAAENSANTEPQAGYVDSAAAGSFDIDASATATWYHNNLNSNAYVGWCWDAGGSGSSNTDGSITSTVSANPTAGFSIVTYTGTGTAATVGHGLGVPPASMVIKCRNKTFGWTIYHQSLGNTRHLDFTDGTGFTGDAWNSTNPTSTVFSIGTDAGSNNGSSPPNNYVAYCFAEVESYSKIGSFVGNGSADGPFVFCGFRPAYVWLKGSTFTSNWNTYDSARSEYNATDDLLRLNSAAAEVSDYSLAAIDLLSNGFKIRTSSGDWNSSGQTFVFCAFAENPFGGYGVSPATAR